MHEVANNNIDFIIADELKDDYILLLGGKDNKTGEWLNLRPSDEPFDIDDLCVKNAKFRTNLEAMMKSITELSRDDNFVGSSLLYIQKFISSQMPMPLGNELALSDRCDALMDNEPFSYFVEHDECMCSERAAMAQYILQQIGIKSYCVSSFAKIQGVNEEPDLHSYIVFEDKGQMFVYDPANPRGDEPRILDTNMNKTIFGDFIEAVNYNKDGIKVNKKRVGFACYDTLDNNKQFVYASSCGVKGQTTSPKKLKEARYGLNQENMRTK